MSEPNSIASLSSPHVKEEMKRFYVFFDVALVLAGFTLVEWIMATLPWNYWLLSIPLVVLSVLKFVGVLAWFMHLRWDHRLCTIIFIAGLVIAGATCFALMALFSDSAFLSGSASSPSH